MPRRPDTERVQGHPQPRHADDHRAGVDGWAAGRCDHEGPVACLMQLLKHVAQPRHDTLDGKRGRRR